MNNFFNFFQKVQFLHPESIIFGGVFILGVNISMAVWWYKYKIGPQWLFWSTLWILHPSYVKKLFINGPGLLYISLWFLFAWLASIYLTPHLF